MTTSFIMSENCIMRYDFDIFIEESVVFLRHEDDKTIR